MLGLLVASCSKKSEPDSDNVVARVGDACLFQDDIQRILTPGLSPDDSARLVKAYVKSWIDSRVMSELAVKNIPDLANIDRMVDDYRSELIAWEYRRLMFNRHGNVEFSQDTINAYYEAHKDEFVLERPLVKGVYIKIADNSPSLKVVKKLYTSRDTADIDRLEKEEMQGIIHYDYFRDRWVDWEQIETRVPADFGSSPEAFLTAHKTTEVSVNGYTYLLDIDDFLPSGSVMPREWAEETVRRTLYNNRLRAFDSQLRIDLLNKGIADGEVDVNIALD